MRKTVAFESNSEIRDFSEYDSNKLAIAKVCVLSTAQNAHGLEISEEVLRRDIGSIRGNFLVADMQLGDATTHTPQEVPVGYFPMNEPIEFEEIETNGRKIVKAWATAVLSKKYAKDAYDMFVKDNHRPTSIEMTVEVAEDDENKVVSFDAYSSTILGKFVAPSCKDAEISLVRFAEEANAFYDTKKDSLTNLQNFAEERRKQMADDKFVNHLINTSKDAIYEGEWDGQKAKRDLVKEEKFRTLAPKVCMKLEDGWEDRKISALGYPVMGLYDGEWRYSRRGLAQALARAEQQDETAVVSKINKIYKKLDLEKSDGKEDTTKMSKEIEFAAVNIGEMWHKLWDILDVKEIRMCIDGIYEEDNQKFAILCARNGDKYRLDFSLTEDGLTIADTMTKVEVQFVPTDKVLTFAEPENVEDYRKFSDDEDDDDDDKKEDEDDDDDKDDEDEDVEMSADEMKAEMARLQSEIENRDNIIMEKDAELEELRQFKAGVEKEKQAMSVEALMAEVKEFIDGETYKKFRDEGLACNMSELDAWSNKVKAFCFENGKKSNAKNDGLWSFAAPITQERKSGSVWDYLKK